MNRNQNKYVVIEMPTNIDDLPNDTILEIKMDNKSIVHVVIETSDDNGKAGLVFRNETQQNIIEMSLHGIQCVRKLNTVK